MPAQNIGSQILLVRGIDIVDRTRDLQECSWPVALNNLGQDQTVAVTFKKASIPNLFNNVFAPDNALVLRLSQAGGPSQDFTIIIDPGRYSLQGLGNTIVYKFNYLINSFLGVTVYGYNADATDGTAYLASGRFTLVLQTDQANVTATLLPMTGGSTMWNQIGHSLDTPLVLKLIQSSPLPEEGYLACKNYPQLNSENTILLTAGRLTPNTAFSTDFNYYNLLATIPVGSVPFGSTIHYETFVPFTVDYFHSRHVSSFEISLRDTSGRLLLLDQASIANIFIEITTTQINA